MPDYFPRKLWLLLILIAVLSGCTSEYSGAVDMAPLDTTVEPTRLPVPTATTTPKPVKVWINTELPVAFRKGLHLPGGFLAVQNVSEADAQITWSSAGGNSVDWVYALVAPFPTVTDEVSSTSLRAAWKGRLMEPFHDAPLLLSSETAAALEALWGKAGEGVVEIVPMDELVDTAWVQRPGWAIVPFEALEPRWKVIQIDGVSPLDPALNLDEYALKVSIGWNAENTKPLPDTIGAVSLSGNRHAEHIARVFMTGTTAMVRNMALRMEEEGILYPTIKIGSLLKSADVTHISNEVPFYSKCPPAKPLRGGMRFCTSPGYIEVLEAVSADVVELTGNHLLDWGPDVFSETLKLYQDEGYQVYGGGWTPEQARQPLKLEVNGNKLAFIGCNPSGPDADWATADRPGSANCDYDWMEARIRELREEGYLPIVTIQHIEVYDYKPTSAQRVISKRMASAGAVLISGSQSHFPQGFTFVGDTLVHYGLGNTFFDQMDFGSSRGFLDRSVFYEGRLISTELFTIKLEDYAQPRLMTFEERRAMLVKVFTESGW